MKEKNHNQVIEENSAVYLSCGWMTLAFEKREGVFYPKKIIDRKNQKILPIGKDGEDWFCLHINGQYVSPRTARIQYRRCEQEFLPNGGVYFRIQLELSQENKVHLELCYHVQMFPDCAMTRHRLELLSNSGDSVALTYDENQCPVWVFPSFSLPAAEHTIELTSLANWRGDDREHSYSPKTVKHGSLDYLNQKGPILSVLYPREQWGWLLCYEHGSPDIPGEDYYHVCLEQAEENSRFSVQSQNRGIYLNGEKVSDRYSGPWVDFGGYPGEDHDGGREMLWQFLYSCISSQRSLCQPFLYYNTWALQRKDQMNGGSLVDHMTEEGLLHQIDLAHDLGIDVFVVDAYWYDRFGDWNPSPERLPHGLYPLLERVRQYGMRLGLWFEPTTASVDSSVVQEHPEWVQQDQMGQPVRRDCWDQKGYRMCLSSGYRQYFTNLLRKYIRAGITYIKWDALDPTECCSSEHQHGGICHSPEERNIRARCKYIEELIAIARELNAECPELIIEFDVTEAERAVGLGFFAEGRYYWTNNGVYGYENFSAERAVTGRKMVYEYGRLIPPVLFNHAQYPHDALGSGRNAVLSSLLGPLGLWGDFEALNTAERDMVRSLVGQYRKLRGKIAGCRPEISGDLGGKMESYRFVDSVSGDVMKIMFHYKGMADVQFISNNKAVCQ